MTLSEKQFRTWLDAYGEAWQARDSGRFAGLFADNALYYWTPFDEPQKGRGEIGKAFLDAIARQSDIDFGARILYTQAQLGAAHWSCAFTRPDSGKRVHLDGVFVVQFADTGQALSLREWWHSDER